ncbi:hypothetical protein BGZ73_002791 [Actinomortierella ambigua]|nr:hypothetical protein BGZ73_002791 [Actinomortierella ambigua]
MSHLGIGDCIGTGTYGSVYRGRWNGHLVAVKRLNLSRGDAKREELVLQEVQALKRLSNHHIIQSHGTSYHHDKLVLVMDFAEGGNLQKAIDGRRLEDWATKSRISQEIVRGLSYLHDHGILHQNLTSSNVLLTQTMQVKLCDYGLAMIKILSRPTSGDIVSGDFRWMAPELLNDEPKWSKKSDMYALGMVMWEMAAGCTLPFSSKPDKATVVATIKGGEREQLPDDTPELYRALVLRCWHQDPKKRPDARDVLEREDGAGSPFSIHFKAEHGDVEAQTLLGTMYESGTGVSRSLANAFKWYMRAAEQGHTEAQFCTAKCLFAGRGTQQSHFEAVTWYRKAAEMDHAQAQDALGLMYQYGYGVGLNYEEALRWFRRAAAHGYPPAEYNIGQMYYSGLGVARDYTEAVVWYRRAASKHFAPAQNGLGQLLTYGLGVEKDFEEAAQLFRMAAEQGHAGGQYSLGDSYENGIGVEKDIDQALLWYKKAALQGYSMAQTCLERLERRLLRER